MSHGERVDGDGRQQGRPGGRTDFAPGTVGRKRNNKALAECPGTGKHHSHLPIISKAMLGCLLNLHNTVPTLLLPLSIMDGMRG